MSRNNKTPSADTLPTYGETRASVPLRLHALPSPSRVSFSRPHSNNIFSKIHPWSPQLEITSPSSVLSVLSIPLLLPFLLGLWLRMPRAYLAPYFFTRHSLLMNSNMWISQCVSTHTHLSLHTLHMIVSQEMATDNRQMTSREQKNT